MSDDLVDWLLMADSVEKVGLVTTAEKYTSEIQILNLRRGIQARISRSGVLIRRFY